MAIIILKFLPIFLLVKLQAIRLFASIYSKDLDLDHSTTQVFPKFYYFRKLISNFLPLLLPIRIISNYLTTNFFHFNINSKLHIVFLIRFIFANYQIQLLICFLYIFPTLILVLTFYLHTSIILTS